MSDFKERIELYFRAGFPALAIETTEEQLVLNEISTVCEKLNLETVEPFSPASDEPFVAKLDELEENNVYFLLDYQTIPIEQDPAMVRQLKELIIECEDKGAKMIFIGNTSKILPSFSNLITIVDYDLPSADELKVIAKEVEESIMESKDVEIKYNKDKVALALRGMNSFEAKNTLFLSFFKTKTFDPMFIQNEKIQSIKKDGILEISNPAGGLDQVGGLENLKKQAMDYAAAFATPDIEKPRGILCCGQSGCGKSLFAKVIGEYMELPTIKFDFSRVESGIVGSSQQNLRKVFKQLEALAPAVVHIDELEKAMAGAGTDTSGVSTKLLGMMLTWMQDYTAPIFIVGTANWFEKIDENLLRRFDETFSIQLPHSVEREEIWKIHLGKRNIAIDSVDIDSLVEATENYTGAEIEKAIKRTVWRSVTVKKDINTELLLELVKETKPQSKTNADYTKRVEKALEMMTPASVSPSKSTKKKVGRRKV